MLKAFSVFLFLFLVLSFKLALPEGRFSVVLAQEFFFQDEFSGNNLDNTKWQAYPNNGTITLGNDVIWLKSGHTKTFPFVYSKSSPIPSSGDFSVEFKLQYTEVTFWGTGVVLSSETPVNGQSEPTNPIFKAWIWDDTTTGNGGFRIDFKDSSQLHPVYSKSPIDLNPHVIKLDYIEGIYKIYLDGSLIYTSSQTTNKPNVIWFGNPVNTGVFPNWNWTAFKLDYVRVKSLAPAKTSLILIPGIGGSELKVQELTNWDQKDGHDGYYKRLYGQDEVVWLNEPEARALGEDDYFDVLRMQTDGVTSEANIGLTGSLVSRAYGEAINFFTDNGYILGTNFFVFPYDWRKDISTTKTELDSKINQIKTQTGAQKVDIVAHSMGGLVARNYIADPAKASNIRKLFTLGTPHLGTAEFLKNLRYGGCLTKPEFQNLPYCIGLTNSEVKDVIQNMISGYQLAPSQAYFNFYSDEDSAHPYPYRTENGSLNYLQIKNYLTNLDYNTSLYNPSETFHGLDNLLSITNGVDVTIIAGSGQPTLGQIIELTLNTLGGSTINFKDKRDINGDGTVPLLSASIIDPHKGLFLNGTAQIFYANQEHGELVISGPALNLVKNILKGNNQLPNNISTQPYKLTGTGLSVHSPVNIHVYDANNNHTGPLPNGDFEVNIPGSSYDTLDDAKFIFLPEGGQYTINFEATDNGSFDFKIRKYEDDINTETILYKEIPLSENTEAETVFDTNSVQPPIISVDKNGDGAIDFNQNPFSILEGNANFDYTPPVISLNVNPKTIWPPNNKMIDVDISGTVTDDNPYLVKILVDDEYNLVEPSITLQNQTNINQIIKLEASRKGNDKDVRKYTIKILATDLSGNTSVSAYEVTVLHDQRKK